MYKNYNIYKNSIVFIMELMTDEKRLQMGEFHCNIS